MPVEGKARRDGRDQAVVPCGCNWDARVRRLNLALKTGCSCKLQSDELTSSGLHFKTFTVVCRVEV